MRFEIVRNGKTLPIAGDFDSIDEVAKLRVFKDNPRWLEFVSAVTKAGKQPRSSNRWRMVLKNGRYVDYLAYYTKQELINTHASILRDSIEKLRIVGMDEYHENDSYLPQYADIRNAHLA